MSFLEQHWRYLVAVGVVLVLILVAFFSGRQCGTKPDPVVNQGDVDAGPGEAIINARLDAQVQATEQQIRQVEQQYQRDIDAFDEHQREEYARVRDGGLEDIAAYLSQWNRRRRDGGR